MKAKEFVPANKPRNFVAKNAMKTTSGAGQHKDKKRADKQGDVKHKNKQYEEGVAEGSGNNDNNDFYSGLYAELLGDVNNHSVTDMVNTKNSIKRALESGRLSLADVKSEIHQLESELKKQGVAEGFFGIDDSIKGKIQNITSDLSDIPGMWDHRAQTFTDAGMDKLKTVLKNNPKYIKYALSLTADDYEAENIKERVRDPEDWDEGNTEPPNNFAIYINGKKWKVFKGRGQFADDYKEIQHYRQLQNWAQEKSQATGKKWEVHRTGEAPTA